MPDEVPKKKRGRPKGSTDKKQRKVSNPDRTSVPKGMEAYNANLHAFLDYITPETRGSRFDLPELKRRFEKYKQACVEFGMRASNINAYRALGIHTQLVFDYVNGVVDCPEETRSFLIEVGEYCASYREMLGIDGKIHPATLIFWQRNYDGLKDQHEQVIINRSQTEEATSENELAKKYLENASVVALPDKSGTESTVREETTIETAVDKLLKESLD